MIKSSINILLTNDNTKNIAKSLQDLVTKKICVGIPEEKNVQREEGDITNAQLLFVHTHGVRDEEMKKAMQKDLDGGMEYPKAHELYLHEYGSPMYHVPPRPILEPALDDGKEVIAELIKEATLNVLEGKDINLELKTVGEEAENIVKDWFEDPANDWAPNAQSTIDKKGSDKPLIDSGDLRKSITYVIRDGDK